jgi:phosphoribosyl-AMP cyclohydrolase
LRECRLVGYTEIMTHEELEEGKVLNLDWNKLASIGEKGCDVLPVAVQDSETRELILVAYANERALKRTIETGRAVFWSTSRNELWEKGLTSGNSYFIEEIRVNCEQNSLLYLVRPEKGKICHTRNSKGVARNCYYRQLDLSSGELVNLDP